MKSEGKNHEGMPSFLKKPNCNFINPIPIFKNHPKHHNPNIRFMTKCKVQGHMRSKECVQV